MLQINKSQQACPYGWLREVHNMKTKFINAACYKSLSADHMIKTAEKHQTLPPPYLKKEHHRFETKDIRTYTKKLQPHGPRVFTTGTCEPHHKSAHPARSSPTRERKHKRNRLVLVTQHTNPDRSLESAAPLPKLPQKHKTQSSKKLWHREHQNHKGQDRRTEEESDEERALQAVKDIVTTN